MTCQIINFTERKREREYQAARAPLHPLLWPALITSCVLCWGVVAVTAIHFVPIISEALRPR